MSELIRTGSRFVVLPAKGGAFILEQGPGETGVRRVVAWIWAPALALKLAKCLERASLAVGRRLARFSHGQWASPGL